MTPGAVHVPEPEAVRSASGRPVVRRLWSEDVAGGEGGCG